MTLFRGSDRSSVMLLVPTLFTTREVAMMVLAASSDLAEALDACKKEQTVRDCIDSCFDAFDFSDDDRIADVRSHVFCTYGARHKVDAALDPIVEALTKLS